MTMKLFTVILLTLFSLVSIAKETISLDTSQAFNEVYDPSFSQNASPIDSNYIFVGSGFDFETPDRSPPSCSWSDCVDGCNQSRINCLKSNSSSFCGPRYESCKKSCDRCN